jgi:hypothetical protein
VHAARPKAIRQMHLGDVGLRNHHLTTTGPVWPLDDLTREMLV